MKTNAPQPFDNLWLRLRRGRCVVGTVAAPFATALWPDVRQLLQEVGPPGREEQCGADSWVQERLLLALAGAADGAGPFTPESIGFKASPQEMRAREEFRRENCFITFLGRASSQVVFGTLDAIARRLSGLLNIHVRLKGWDALSEWPAAREPLAALSHHLFAVRRASGSVNIYSEFSEIPAGLWDFIYGQPRVHLVWLGRDLAQVECASQVQAYRADSLPLRNIGRLADMGISVRTVLPASKANVGILREITETLADVTRGGRIRIVPTPLLSEMREIPGPDAQAYATQVLAIYTDSGIPLRVVFPHSWVADRVDACVPLVGSPEAGGAAITVLADGNVYAGENCVGAEAWRMGNVLDDVGALRWERLWAMPEAFSHHSKPDTCRICEWRHRCGGIDASVLLLAECPAPEGAARAQYLHDLYCAPRKALFAEALWDSVAQSAEFNETRNDCRELVEVHEDAISFRPATLPGRSVPVSDAPPAPPAAAPDASSPLTETGRHGGDGLQPRRLSWCAMQRSLPGQRSVHAIDLDVTEACNLACPYCFKWQKKAVNMDEATAKGAIDWLLDASGNYRGELKVNLLGGEPLLRYDLIQRIVPYGKCRARQCGKSLHFGCTTNCTLLTDEMLAFWKRFGMGFHCSIDGVPEVQNANRPTLGGGPSAPAVEKNARKILAYRPEVMARSTITPHSVPFLCESAKYLAGLGFRSLSGQVAVNCDWKREDFDEMRRQYERLGAYFVDRLVSPDPLEYAEFSGGLRLLNAAVPRPRQPCGAGSGLVLVDPRGDIWPCHRFGPHQCGGGFRLGALGRPFNDRLRDVFLKYDAIEDARANCAACVARAICRHWCYVECLDCSRSLYDPGRDYCEAIRILYDEIVAIDDHLKLHHPAAFDKWLKEARA